jgi:hypothetical protein
MEVYHIWTLGEHMGTNRGVALKDDGWRLVTSAMLFTIWPGANYLRELPQTYVTIYAMER